MKMRMRRKLKLAEAGEAKEYKKWVDHERKATPSIEIFGN